MKNTIVINANENCICDLLSTVDNGENRFLLEIRVDTTKNPKLEINNEQIVITGSPFLYEVGSTYYLGSGELTFRIVDDVHTGDYFHVTKVAEVDGNLFLNQINNFHYQLLYIPARNETGGLTLDKVYPVGSVYISAGNVNPNTIFAGTTWEPFGIGRTLVGCDTNDTDFAGVGKTGGEKTHTLTAEEMPSHNHDVTVETKELKGSVWNFVGQNANYGPGNSTSGVFSKGGDGTCFYPSSTGKATGVNDGFIMDATHKHTASASNTGSGTAHNNMPPYITVCMWKRTA